MAQVVLRLPRIRRAQIRRLLVFFEVLDEEAAKHLFHALSSAEAALGFEALDSALYAMDGAVRAGACAMDAVNGGMQALRTFSQWPMDAAVELGSGAILLFQDALRATWSSRNKTLTAPNSDAPRSRGTPASNSACVEAAPQAPAGRRSVMIQRRHAVGEGSSRRSSAFTVQQVTSFLEGATAVGAGLSAATFL
eukprot:CAMPEP_0194773412 /NCGR_PEP_ID=MMETSP0323_2-20130528/54775_1 /TAXON_ID=2866 ORGANISM="Crypthecodinium cohnii, Strain Seligo" /NCGR_SAMPLE_ID=MMETSP0323_2 /ASSEMBLY_ACC=CAM_ASM_000346 /LENGTH=193 /DNA_ID=CAMNT_0039708441 /DNA_START=45 /DNA_END=626 /DNA_ORIENTATION=-